MTTEEMARKEQDGLGGDVAARMEGREDVSIVEDGPWTYFTSSGRSRIWVEAAVPSAFLEGSLEGSKHLEEFISEEVNRARARILAEAERMEKADLEDIRKTLSAERKPKIVHVRER